MSPERWAEVQAVFHGAVVLHGEARAEYLNNVSAKDPELAQEVGRMLDAHASGSRFAEPPDKDALMQEMSPADYLEGTRLGDFELGAELGRGGMGIVYEARQISLDRKVAVKVLPPALAASGLRLARFRREALAASRLDHPGLAPPIVFDEADGVAYYAMKLAEGPSLSALIRAKLAGHPMALLPDSPEGAARLIRSLLETLEHVHEHGLVHRDVKPGNLIQTADGPVLIDFGLAKDFELEDLSRTGAASGTPFYMSPEQVRAKKNTIDRRTDIYSAGAVLFELLTGAPPFTGSGTIEIFKKITDEQPAAMRDVPRPLELITRKALSKEPRDRYQTAAGMAADLERFLTGQQVEARPPSLAKEALRLYKRRRTLVLGTPLILLALLVGRFCWPPGIDPGSVRFDLSHAEVQSGITLTAARFLDGFGATTRIEVGPKPLEAGLVLTLEPALWRFTLLAGDGRVSELILTLLAGEDTVLEPRKFSPPEAGPGMVNVPGKVIALTTTGQTPVQASDQAEFAVASFALDLAVVTNGELRAAFEDAGLWPPPGVNHRVLQEWAAPTRSDWSGLPATGLSIHLMRTYAALAGKRLPTLAEMTLAAELCLEDWDPSTANLQPGLGGNGVRHTTWDMYFDSVRPARTGARATGPLGLFQPFGNVRVVVESHFGFTELPPMLEDAETPLERLYFTQTFGGFWADRTETVADDPLHMTSKPLLGHGAPENGFRCARSLPLAPRDSQ